MNKIGLKNLISKLNLKQGELIIAGGRPLMGKTLFFLNLVQSFCENNKNCLYLSDIENKELLVQRLAHQAIGLNLKENLADKEMKQVIKAIDDISKWNLFFACNICNNKDFTYQKIKELIEDKKPDYVFIDFNALPKSLKNLKELAINRKTVIFVSTNLKATNEKNGYFPILEDLKDYKNILKSADKILLLHRPYYYDCTIEEDLKTAFFIICNKFQGGKIMLNYDNKTGKIN